MTIKTDIIKKINDNSIVIGVIGLGYVGLPLAVAFASKGIKTIGFEKDYEKISNINNGKNYISDVEDKEFVSVVENRKLWASNDFSKISICDSLFICVPTPLDKYKKPDMSHIEAASKEIGTYIKRGVFICLESTTFPTTTENIVRPIIEKTSGMICGKDFWLAFSPERVDPGNSEYKISNTPKVIGAITDDCLEIGIAIYKLAIDSIYTVSCPKTAEMVKILENTYRLVNISLINELALLCGKMDINIWEVIEAARTKPYGFHAFYPGPGIGGHCIPLDPFYLEYIAKKHNFDLTMIHTAGQIDTLMPHRMTVKISSALNRHKKSINGSKILFLGVAFKPDIADERESPALKIIDEVLNKGGFVEYYDPYINSVITPQGRKLTGIHYSKKVLNEFDCVVLTTKHKVYKPDEVIKYSKLIVDLVNLLPKKSINISKL